MEARDRSGGPSRDRGSRGSLVLDPYAVRNDGPRRGHRYSDDAERAREVDAGGTAHGEPMDEAVVGRAGVSGRTVRCDVSGPGGRTTSARVRTGRRGAVSARLLDSRRGLVDG